MSEKVIVKQPQNLCMGAWVGGTSAFACSEDETRDNRGHKRDWKQFICVQ